RATAGGANFSTVASTYDGPGVVTSATTTDGNGYGALVRSTPRDSHGFSLSESTSHPGSPFTRSLTFSPGSPETAQWSGMTWFSMNNVIDSTTGLVSASSDTSGLSTSFAYDALGRPLTRTPPGGDAAATITYDSPTQSTSRIADSNNREYGWTRTM